MYLLNYIGAENRLYLCDKELCIVSFKVLRAVLEYQTAVMRKDLEAADKILPMVPRDQRTRVAHFLEKQGYLRQAMAVTSDVEHRFDLALKLADLMTAHRILQEAPDQLTDVRSLSLPFCALISSVLSFLVSV